MRWLWFLACIFAVGLTGCPGCARYARCPDIPPDVVATLPARLSATGFDEAKARAFAPAFALWSDGATKRRWMMLPPGTKIDTADMDEWSFPVGTRFWKEFTRDGTRVETRYLERTKERWIGASYVWLPDQSDAMIALDGAKDILGTAHDAPAATQCAGCHGGRASFVLGFSAVQLGNADDGRSLAALVDDGLLTHVPPAGIRVPGTVEQRAALGYLHANCGNCHNARRPPRTGERCYDPERSFDLSLPWAPLADVAATPFARTTVPDYVTPGDPDDSRLLALVARRGMLLHMPPLGTEQVDVEGVALLRTFVATLPRGQNAPPF